MLLNVIPFWLINVSQRSANCIVCKGFPQTPCRHWEICVVRLTRLTLDPLAYSFRMTSKPIELDPYHHAYACDCLGWKCFICNKEAKDQIGLEDQFLADGYTVFTDSIDGAKWVFCTTCKKAFHLKCVTSETEEQIHSKGWPFTCTCQWMQGESKSSRWPLPIPIEPITKTRSINRVTKRVTISRLCFSFYKMKKKFSKKGKGGKVLRTPDERKKASSHAGQRLQQWKEEQMEEADRLWKLNEILPPNERLSMRAIAKKVKIGKTTVIKRLSGRRVGVGHITGGQWQARVLTTGESSGSLVTRS